MRKFFFSSTSSFSVSAFANDGVFYATRAIHWVPLKETVVRLKKEILNLTRKGRLDAGGYIL